MEYFRIPLKIQSRNTKLLRRGTERENLSKMLKTIMMPFALSQIVVEPLKDTLNLCGLKTFDLFRFFS